MEDYRASQALLSFTFFCFSGCYSLSVELWAILGGVTLKKKKKDPGLILEDPV